MYSLYSTVLLWSIVCCTSSYAIDDYAFSFAVDRDVADADTVQTLATLRRRDTEHLSFERGKSLYWFGNFSVGGSTSVRLLIDTGSSDLILNKGVYKPTDHEKPYGTGHFTASYEGVNRVGFGFETIKGTVKRDIARAGDLAVTEQAIGSVTSVKYKDVRPLKKANPGQGIIGFLASGSSQFNPPAESWFFNLCRHKSLPECRFGFAFGTSGKGSAVIGKVGHELIDGDLVRVPHVEEWGPYSAIGDVTINDTIVLKNQTFVLDCGTDNIQGPLSATRKLFHILGYESHLKTSDKNPYHPGVPFRVLTGFFPCDKPPQLVSFPAQDALKKGEKATIFNVSPTLWDVYDHGNNNCTSILGGSNTQTTPKTHEKAWLIGQPFFAGHYLDFDIDSHTVGFGKLKDPRG